MAYKRMWVTSSMGRSNQMVVERGGGEDGGLCGYCMMGDSYLKGEGEGCQVSECSCRTMYRHSVVGEVSQ